MTDPEHFVDFVVSSTHHAPATGPRSWVPLLRKLRAAGWQHEHGCGSTCARPCRTPRGSAAVVAVVVLLLVGVVLLAVFGCSNPPDKGVVYDKQDVGAYMYFQNTCVSYDSRGACTNWMMMPIYVPETWKVCLEDNSSDKPKRGCREVDHATYDRVKVGDYWSAVKR